MIVEVKMYEAGWIRDDDKHYCPDCTEYDENDNLLIIKIKF